MKLGGSRDGGEARQRYLLAGIGTMLLLSAACDAPGRPKAEEVNPENATDFATLYDSNCAGCHSADGKNGPARPLNNALYLSIIPKEELKKVIVNGRKGTGMPAWAKSQGGPLSDQQVDVLVDGIEKEWGKPVNPPLSKPPAYAATAAGDPVGGKKLFGRACFVCHGPGAPVGLVTDPTYLALASDQLLRTSVIEGWPALGMPDYRTVNLGHELSDQNITDIVAYLSSLRPVAPNSQALHINENGPGEGEMRKGNEGSGNGPGSPQKRENEGNKVKGPSQGGGVK